MPSFKKKSSEARFKGKGRLKALEDIVQCVYGPVLEYGNEQSFSFTDTWIKENKTGNRDRNKRCNHLC